MTQWLDIKGHRYELLEILELSHIDENGKSHWIARCDCGNVVTVRVDSIRSKRRNTLSCGCYQRSQLAARNRTRRTKIE